MDKIVVTHNAGFFSCCSMRLAEIIKYVNKYRKFPIVDSSEQWSMYKDSYGDITDSFFKTDIQDLKEITKDIVCNGWPFYDNDVDAQISPYKNLDFKELNFIIYKYFSLSDVVMQIYNTLISKYKIDLDKTIAIYYRGNDKHRETNLPSYEEFIQKIDELKAQYPDYKLLIQSDEVSIYEKILAKYPDSIYFDEIAKSIPNANYSIAQIIPVGEKKSQAILFLAIVKIISQCSKIIFNSGNVSMWICFYRGNTDGIYQYLNHKEYIYGVQNKFYIKDNNNFWI